MNFFVVIRGPLGVGKTTIAKKIAETLVAEYIVIDALLSKKKLDRTGGDIPVENFLLATKVVLPRVKRILETGKCVVFDGNFYNREQIVQLVEELPFAHFIFTLKAPLAVCIKRDSQRKKPYGKPATKAVYKLVSKVKIGISIDTNGKSEEEVTNAILKTVFGQKKTKRMKII